MNRVFTHSRRLAGVVLAVAMLTCGAASPASAWGFEVHKLITDRAIDLLPPRLKPFFERYRAFVVEHSIDPDLWRTAGFEDEPKRHFLDLDAYGDGPPFAALPRDFDEAVAKYGKAHVENLGTLPWRTAEFQANLVRAFEEQRLGTSPWALEDIRFFAATLAHYVSDAHVPQHAVMNYDGQLTDQQGIHNRFETELVLRYVDRLHWRPTARPAVTDARTFTFEALFASFAAAPAVERADRDAIGAGTEYDDAYFDRFFALARPVLEERLTRASEAVASLIVGAWEAGGRPDLPLERKVVIHKRRRGTGGQ